MNYFMIAMLASAFMFTGCKDDPAPAPEKGDFATLSSYMASNGLDLPDVLTSPTKWVVAPNLMSDGGIVDANADHSIPGYHVFDIRKVDDFNDGHIKGSINVLLTDVVTKAKEVGKDKPILVVCYSGQTAGRAVMALRLSGFSDAQVMKFGFSYWSSDGDFDKWSGKTLNGAGDQAAGSTNWKTDASTNLPSNDYPTWTSNTTDGAALLAERVTAMLGMSWNIAADVPLADPAGYEIYNYWNDTDYVKYGHYKHAYQMMPISIANDVLKAFPQSGQFLVYCYTGQTSSFATAWLQVLGYEDATSILYGVNNLQYTELLNGGSTVWKHSKEYPYVSTK